MFSHESNIMSVFFSVFFFIETFPNLNYLLWWNFNYIYVKYKKYWRTFFKKFHNQYIFCPVYQKESIQDRSFILFLHLILRQTLYSHCYLRTFPLRLFALLLDSGVRSRLGTQYSLESASLFCPLRDKPCSTPLNGNENKFHDHKIIIHSNLSYIPSSSHKKIMLQYLISFTNLSGPNLHKHVQVYK